MDELVAFLRAALDRDEQVAQAAIADDGGQDGGFEDADWLDNPPWQGSMRFGHDAAGLIRSFAVPRRVLAEVQAKRRILELHWPDASRYVKPQCHECSSCGCCSVDHPCDTIRLLAQPYAGQPGWREEWAL